MPHHPKFNANHPSPPLLIGEPESFAYRTMTTRIPAIVKNILADYANMYSAEAKLALQDLLAELLENKAVRPLETSAPDGASWTAAWRPYRDQNWFDLPWYFAEAFFYRRLLEAVGYFGHDEWAGVDPYLPRKQAELGSDTPWQILSLALQHSIANSGHSFRALLHHCVWGNRVDLSYAKVAEAAGEEIALEREQANLLVDDTAAVLTHLQPSIIDTRPSATSARIDFICDNAGTELLMDLALTDFLLRFAWTRQVTLHVKAHPTFVSDAIEADVEMTIAAIKIKPAPELQALANRLEAYRQANRLQLQSNFFWNSSRFFWELPATLQAELAQARLIVLKGDANYRRLLGDSRWPTTVPLVEAVPYFPAPFVTLRTMKSDPVVGLQSGQAEALNREDSEWRVNGKRGMIQAVL